jgi:hypothetical protein
MSNSNIPNLPERDVPNAEDYESSRSSDLSGHYGAAGPTSSTRNPSGHHDDAREKIDSTGEHSDPARAWGRIGDARKIGEPLLQTFTRDASGYTIHDGKGKPLPDLAPKLEIFLAPLIESNSIAGFHVWLTCDGYDQDSLAFQLSTNPLITWNTPRNALLAMWKAEIGSQEEWRDIVADLFDEEDEYTWKNQFGQETNVQWGRDQQIVFKLKHWMKENGPGRFKKRLPPPGNTRGTPPRWLIRTIRLIGSKHFIASVLIPSTSNQYE